MEKVTHDGQLLIFAHIAFLKSGDHMGEALALEILGTIVTINPLSIILFPFFSFSRYRYS